MVPLTASVDAGTWLAVLGLASLSIVSAVVGVALARRAGPREGLRAAGIGFSVGVMVVIAVVELLPEATREAGWGGAVASALAGAGLLAVLHVAVPHVHLVEELGGRPDRAVRRAFLVAFGLILHDVPEGFAMANAFLASPALGGLVAIAIVVHNVPEEFAIALPAIVAGRPRFALGAAAVSALAEPAGALIGLVAVSVSPGLNAAFLAFAAGAMIYVSFHELVPLGRELGRPWVTLAGGAVAVVVALGLRLLIVG